MKGWWESENTQTARRASQLLEEVDLTNIAMAKEEKKLKKEHAQAQQVQENQSEAERLEMEAEIAAAARLRAEASELASMQAGGMFFSTQFRSFRPFCFARALWQIAPPPLGGRRCDLPSSPRWCEASK